jgi:hypothetical protein
MIAPVDRSAQNPTSLLHPEAPLMAPFTTPSYGYTDTFDIPPRSPSICANPPSVTPIDVNVHVELGLINGASCFNKAVRHQQKDAQEEVRRLTEANRLLLRERC